MTRTVPGILIAGTSSGVGKTTVATGVMGALCQRGLAVQPFKVGPDYIDPSYHSRTCCRPSRNLDSWMVSPPVLQELYARAIASADIAMVEGVMGLFDGRSGLDPAGSSAEVAKLLGLPVLLVIDVSKMARSAAAMALGYLRFDPLLNMAGVIANNVGSPGHLKMIGEAIRESTGLPLVGYLPRRADLELPERHLGLIPTTEGQTEYGFFSRLIRQVEESIDLETVLQLASQAQPREHVTSGLFPSPPKSKAAVIGIAQDEAFSFYYQDNLDLLSAWGAKLLPFSPLHDNTLPEEADGIYLGGGFPEMFAERLAANQSMADSIRAARARNMPVYAECGGLMYLCESVTDIQGQRHDLVGLVPASVTMRDKRLALGYTEVKARKDSILLEQGQTARGHEFHWSGLETPLLQHTAAYEVVEDGRIGAGGRTEGYQEGNLLASYIHLHFASNPRLAANFVEACSRWRKR